MTCPEHIDLTAYLHGEGTPPEREAVELHAATCAGCRQELVDLGRVVGRLRSAVQIEPSPDFVDRVMAALPAEWSPARRKAAAAAPAAGGSLWIRLRAAWSFQRGPLPAWAISTGVHAVLLAALIFLLDQKSPSGIPLPYEVAVRPKHTGLMMTYNPDSENWGQADTMGSPDAGHPTGLFPADAFARMRDDGWGAAIAGVRRSRKASADQARALSALVRGQSPDGSWPGAGADDSVAATSLSLLSLMSHGHTSNSGSYQRVVRRGVDYLVRNIGPAGHIGPASAGMTQHALGLLAVLENATLSFDPDAFSPATRSVKYSLARQMPDGSWSPGRNASDDTPEPAATFWNSLALRHAAALGFPGAAEAVTRAAKHFAETLRGGRGATPLALDAARAGLAILTQRRAAGTSTRLAPVMEPPADDARRQALAFSAAAGRLTGDEAGLANARRAAAVLAAARDEALRNPGKKPAPGELFASPHALAALALLAEDADGRYPVTPS